MRLFLAGTEAPSPLPLSLQRFIDKFFLMKFIFKNGETIRVMYYFDLLKEFHTVGIKYMIAGGLSVNLHGIPRVTQDIDIVISPDRENILLTVSVLKKLGFVPVLPVNPEDLADESIRESWIREKNMVAFSFHHTTDNYRVIDIILVHPLDLDSAYLNRTVKSVRDFTVNLVSIDDLIKMKKFSGRAQDLSDIEMLYKLKDFMAEEHE